MEAEDRTRRRARGSELAMPIVTRCLDRHNVRVRGEFPRQGHRMRPQPSSCNLRLPGQPVAGDLRRPGLKISHPVDCSNGSKASYEDLKSRGGIPGVDEIGNSLCPSNSFRKQLCGLCRPLKSDHVCPEKTFFLFRTNLDKIVIIPIEFCQWSSMTTEPFHGGFKWKKRAGKVRFF